jgi:hypothetical protein
LGKNNNIRGTTRRCLNMNKNHMNYEVILRYNNIKKEVEIYFDNNLNDTLRIIGGNFFYISKETNDTTNLSFFDFCEELSNDSNYLKKIAFRRYKELNLIFGDNINFKKEKERLDFINLFQEEESERANTLISKYFEIFKTDRINKNNWEDFIKYFDLNKITPIVDNVIKDGKKTILHDGNKNYLDLLNNKNSNIDISGFKKIIEKSDLFSQKHYNCSNSKEIITILISNLFESKPNAVVKRCRNCQKLFIPNKADTICCTRKSSDVKYKNKTCGEIYKIELKKEPCKKLYKDIYDMQTKRIIRCKNSSKDDEKKAFLKAFMDKARVKKRKVKSGAITKDEYFKWLKEIKETGVIPND